jgi:aminoglycoside phosphotransferase (APT) family kinase protein
MVTDAEPFSLVHGDYRLDNLMFGADGAVTALDWQTLTIGPPLQDVAYFLGTSVEPAIRRLHEEQILRRYHSSLVDEGVRDFDWDRCWKA